MTEFGGSVPVYVLAPTNYIKVERDTIVIDMKNNFEANHLNADTSTKTKKMFENNLKCGYQFAQNGGISWEDYYAAIRRPSRNCSGDDKNDRK